MTDAAREIERDGRLVLAEPAALPPVLDALIVGGGPFGTAAAFRAKELGLAALVIDYDDLMKRIRDYAKDKLILPDYGGGDRMQFPKAGPLIEKLHFAPIDKDRMCVEWKALYRAHSVPAQIGIELTGLEPEGDYWKALCWNHNLKSEQNYFAKHVVLAFGRGVPRRLDVPGDVSGLAFGLTDATKYVGEPACVIGGGTSAGEAVIAISNAKAGASDPSAVYWSYRGDKMPKVSKALADVFFDAFMGNGNVRYLPSSDPMAIVDSSGRPHLSLRTSRVATPGRPAETTQLEFARDFCIACIGEDIPEALLTRVGVPLVTGGPANKSRPAVTPLLETRQHNVYLAGDVLSPAYFETTDLAGDPSQFVEVKRRGNIKAAMRDGVLVAEVMAQKLAGRVQINVQLDFVDSPALVPEAASGEKGEAEKAARIKAGPVAAKAVVAAGSLPVGPPGNSSVLAPRCALVSILSSGVEANEFPLKSEGVTTVGRQGADIAFQDDPTLGNVHAAVLAKDGVYYVQDDESKGDVLLQPTADRTIELERGAVVRAGRQWLVVGSKTSATSLVHYDEAGQRRASFELKDGLTVIGRQSPDLTIAPDDSSLSRRHLALTVKSGRVSVKDLGSANGTQVRVSSPMRLSDGDRIVLGQQLLEFRDDRAAAQPAAQVYVDTSIGMPLAEASRVREAMEQRAPVVAQGSAVLSASGPGVFFEGLNQLAPCAKGETICEAAEKAGVKIEADCHQGVCGMDPVRIIEGAEHLNPIGGTERSTLEDLCSLDPGPYRLACMARVSGAVKVAVLKQ